MKNFLQEGDVVSVAAPAAVTSGKGVLVGTMFGVATADAASGATVAIKTNGVVSLDKATGQSWTVGAAIYWDNSAKNCTTTTTSNTKIGVAIAAAASADTVGSVRLNGAF